MSVHFYLLIHFIGIFTLFIGLGVLAIQGANGAHRKQALIFHGIGMLFMLVSGFGLLARSLQSQWTWWVFVKIGIWVVMGASVVLFKKEIVKGPAAWVTLIILGSIAAWFGVMFGPY